MMRVPDLIITIDNTNDAPRPTPPRLLAEPADDIFITVSAPSEQNGLSNGKAPAFWRTFSRDSTFGSFDGTFDDEDEELTRIRDQVVISLPTPTGSPIPEELTRIIRDQVVISLTSPTGSPSPEMPIEFSNQLHPGESLSLPKYCINSRTPEPTLNSLQVVNLSASVNNKA